MLALQRMRTCVSRIIMPQIPSAFHFRALFRHCPTPAASLTSSCFISLHLVSSYFIPTRLISFYTARSRATVDARYDAQTRAVSEVSSRFHIFFSGAFIRLSSAEAKRDDTGDEGGRGRSEGDMAKRTRRLLFLS